MLDGPRDTSRSAPPRRSRAPRRCWPASAPGGALRVSVLGSARHNPFTDGGRELFDCAAQGRIDAFFLGGGQIDGAANINLVGVGGYPAEPGALARLLRLRLSLFPGAAGHPVPRGAHAARAGAAGRLHQRAGHQPGRRLSPRRPYALVTGRACSASIAPARASLCRARIPVIPSPRSWRIPASPSRCRMTSPRRRRPRRPRSP